MKILVFGVVALLYMQTIHADTCDDELSSLEIDGDAYLTAFETEHNIDKGYVGDTGDICNQLLDALAKYGASNYGTNLTAPQLKSDVNTFAVAFFAAYITASDKFTRLLNGIDILEEQTACLRAKYDLTCVNGSNLSGCPADLNNAKCILAPLTSAVPAAAATARTYVLNLRDGAITLNQWTRALSAQYYLACACDENGSCVGGNLPLQAVTDFFSAFVTLHGTMHDGDFLSLKGLCTDIAAAITTTKAAFS